MSLILFVSLSVLIFVFLAAFSVASLTEKEYRAFSISAVLTAIFLLMHTGLVIFNPGWLWGMNLLYFFLVVLFFIPAASSDLVNLNPQPIDERDIMFARARYQPGLRAYQDYYTRNPQKQKIDDQIRSLPDLLSPGGPYYDERSASMAHLFFAETERLAQRAEGEPALEQTPLSPDDAAAQLKSMARSLGAVDSGIARIRPEYLYTHIGRGQGVYGDPIDLDHPRALVFAVEMKYNRVRQAPKIAVTLESAEQYLQSAHIAVTVAEYIRSLGYPARAHIDGNYRLMLPGLASDAGLGEIGRLGYLIHPRFGARVRLAAVSTTLPIAEDERRVFGVQDFCAICKKCASNCPAGAISFGPKKNVRGVIKWSTCQEACYRYWRSIGTDCGLCMRICPYSKPDTWTHNLIRNRMAHSAPARRLGVYADDLFYGQRRYNRE
ncbi:MAG: reductive dehalogenase domain-containing protein [candidate division KSB1 bacterium]|nr:reductive dehalogenase domain-containing protein [candidate division KSB1 bacterium]